LTLAHGLGVRPKFVTLELVCITAELGHSVGDVIAAGLNNYLPLNGDSFISLGYDATNVTVRISFGAPKTFITNNPGTGVTVALTNANWNLRVRAFA
jgi:hypothetical protein